MAIQWLQSCLCSGQQVSVFVSIWRCTCALVGASVFGYNLCLALLHNLPRDGWSTVIFHFLHSMKSLLGQDKELPTEVTHIAVNTAAEGWANLNSQITVNWIKPLHQMTVWLSTFRQEVWSVWTDIDIFQLVCVLSALKFFLLRIIIIYTANRQLYFFALSLSIIWSEYWLHSVMAVEKGHHSPIDWFSLSLAFSRLFGLPPGRNFISFFLLNQ